MYRWLFVHSNYFAICLQLYKLYLDGIRRQKLVAHAVFILLRTGHCIISGVRFSLTLSWKLLKNESRKISKRQI